MDTASSWDGGQDQALREAADALARAARAILRADAALESAAHHATDAGQGHRLRAAHSPAWRAVVDAMAPLAAAWRASGDDVAPVPAPWATDPAGDAEDVEVTDADVAAAVRRAVKNARAGAGA